MDFGLVKVEVVVVVVGGRVAETACVVDLQSRVT